MEITLSVRQVLDDILADSALNAIFNKNSTLLTPDQRPALERTISAAATTVAAEAAGRLTRFALDDASGTITFITKETDANPEALQFHLQSAISFAALKLVAISIGDHRRAQCYLACQNDTLATLLTVLDPLPRRMRFTPHYYL